MNTRAVTAALAAAAIAGMFGCVGGKDAKDKPSPSADTSAVATDTVAAVPDTVAADTPPKPVAKKPKPVITTFTDSRDGKVYRKIKVGTQTWMGQNLNYVAEGSVCYDNKTVNCAKYGRLYDWETALKACPAGFHLPIDAEWDTLVEYVDGWSTAGIKLKSSDGWKDNGNGTDDYGFSALPGGFGIPGDYRYAGSASYWWSATEIDAHYSWSRYADHYAWSRYVDYLNESMGRISNDKAGLFSVRCVQDD